MVDKGSFFEIVKEYGKSVVTGFCRLNGWPIALMASDPYSYGGCWTSDTCKKVQKYVDLAETFHLPSDINSELLMVIAAVGYDSTEKKSSDFK